MSKQHDIIPVRGLSAEDEAMLQALYSRSSESVRVHLKKVEETGSADFMKDYYVGYNHQSIGDCGSSTVCLEGVSMLAAKAFQDNELYSGQESSTRYIDFSKQPRIDPMATLTSSGTEIQQAWIDFYTAAQEPLEKHLRNIYPKQEGEKGYKRAIKAKVFDILRGFLPAGATTQLSWHSNLRQFADKIKLLRHHPLAEVSHIAGDLLEVLQAEHPNSFGHKEYDDQEAYNAKIVGRLSYFEDTDLKSEDDFYFSTNIDKVELRQYAWALKERPQKTNLPLFLKDLGTCTFRYLIDFGSFRDVQRHRNGVCRMPILMTDSGFNSWYLDQLPPNLRAAAEELIAVQTAKIRSLACSVFIQQYYVAMGFNVPVRVTYGLPASVYVTELRSSRFVHPTLRRRAHQMRSCLLGAIDDLVLHCDMDPTDFDARRGLQTITKKEES